MRLLVQVYRGLLVHRYTNKVESPKRAPLDLIVLNEDKMPYIRVYRCFQDSHVEASLRGDIVYVSVGHQGLRHKCLS